MTPIASNALHSGFSSLHVAFLKRAADHGSDASNGCALGAFLTLRLVDQFSAGKSANPDALAYQIRATGDFLSDLHPRTIEVNHLAEVVRVAEGVLRNGKSRMLWPPLLAFAYWLEQELRLDEALDVLDTAERLSDGQLAEEELATLMQRARVLRRSGRLPDATACYKAAGALALTLQDHHSELLSRVGRAIVLQKLGDLPESERLLRGVLSDAQRQEDRQAEAVASHDLAVALHLMGRNAEAPPLTFRAHELYDQPLKKAMAMSDTGTMLMELGQYAAAKDALLLVLSSSPPPNVRVRAEGELLALSALIQDRVSFERWRRNLQADYSEFPPDMQVDFEMKLGAGLGSFSRFQEGEEHLLRAVQLAEQHGLGENLFRAEGLLTELRERRGRMTPAATPPQPAAPTPELRETIESLRTLRAERETLVGV